MQISIRLPGTSTTRHYRKSEVPTGTRLTIGTFDGSCESCYVSEDAEPQSLELPSQTQLEGTTKELYVQTVQQALDLIASGEASKLVISRIELVEKPIGFDPITAFNQLAETYPDACVYLLKHEQHGIWLGATPETLVARHGNQCSTMALAGTLSVNDSTQWTAKELQEQEFVSESIRETLRERSITFTEGDVFDKVAGKVKHLCSPFNWQQAGTVLDIARALHPTPAVSGTPKDVACALIPALEEHDRGLYTGFFGLASGEEETYFVNLRCMQVLRDQLAVYVGGGITADSHIESEWNETVLKSATMLEAL